MIPGGIDALAACHSRALSLHISWDLAANLAYWLSVLRNKAQSSKQGPVLGSRPCFSFERATTRPDTRPPQALRLGLHSLAHVLDQQWQQKDERQPARLRQSVTQSPRTRSHAPSVTNPPAHLASGRTTRRRVFRGGSRLRPCQQVSGTKHTASQRASYRIRRYLGPVHNVLSKPQSVSWKGAAVRTSSLFWAPCATSAGEASCQGRKKAHIYTHTPPQPN